MTDAEVKTAYENNPDTNALTDLLKAKLEAIDISVDGETLDPSAIPGCFLWMDSEDDDSIVVKNDLKGDNKYNVIETDFAILSESNRYLRHDAKKLAEIIIEL